MPLSEKARIEVYRPDLPRPAYRDLLGVLEQEFTYTFGGCTTMRGLEGNYLSRGGAILRDRINLLCTDTPFEMQEHLALIDNYMNELKKAANRALDEEAILVAVLPVRHGQ